MVGYLLPALKIVTPEPVTLALPETREAAALDDVDAAIQGEPGVARDG